MSNRLANAASPYLLQHQDNPVDWYEWGDEAFAAAANRDVPILLSVGYSACHWCHVMAHESFEDETTAAVMNAHFVNIKVDREERPDVDRVYMDAVTAMSGHGGWPMTVFLTPDGKPFFAGTYFPKEPHHGRPSFRDILGAVDDAWRSQRNELADQADRLTKAIGNALQPTDDLPDATSIDGAVTAIETGFDAVSGGFGGAPKFPQAPTLEFLMRVAAHGRGEELRGRALGMVDTTLDHIARGGIHDHLGGGFARYSVDDVWLVPHFEKMLYDNALLARTYLRAWQLTKRPEFADTARRTLDYLASEMRDPSGGLHSAEDADSEGVEGKYYVWSWAELGDVLGSDRDEAAALYGLRPEGNFEGNNILFLPEWPTEASVRAGIDARLLATRKARKRPGRDDKVVTAWNGMALRAFAEAAAVLADVGYRTVAEGIADFLVSQHREHGTLLRSWRRGRPGPTGFCDDYGAAALGFFSLYQTTGDDTWYGAAERLVREMIERFADPAGGFFATAADGEALIARPKNVQDNPTPSDNALAAEALLILGAYTGEPGLLRRFEDTVRTAGAVMERHPAFAGQMLAVYATSLHGIREVAAVGAPALEAVIWEAFRPDVVLATGGASVPLLADREPGKAYVCRNHVCSLPIDHPADLRKQLSG